MRQFCLRAMVFLLIFVSSCQTVAPKQTVSTIVAQLPAPVSVQNAELWKPFKNPLAVIVHIPGSWPAEVYFAWAKVLAQAGYAVLNYDKPNEVEAACALAKSELGSQVKIILWTDTRGTQPVLSSLCAQKNAAALVFVSPIPERIDHFWVDGLKQASQLAPEPSVRVSLAQRARNLRATFESIEKGHFEAGSKVMGMTLEEWKTWVAVTKKTPNLIKHIHVPILFLLGQNDIFYPERAKPLLPLKILPSADHHLLTEGVIAPQTQDLVLAALVNLLKRD